MSMTLLDRTPLSLNPHPRVSRHESPRVAVGHPKCQKAKHVLEQFANEAAEALLAEEAAENSSNASHKSRKKKKNKKKKTEGASRDPDDAASASLAGHVATVSAASAQLDAAEAVDTVVEAVDVALGGLQPFAETDEPLSGEPDEPQRPPPARAVSLAEASFDTGRPAVPESTIGGETTCIICFSNPKSHLAVPCGHLCACGPCSQKMEQCPYCRGPVMMWVEARVV